MYMYIYMRIGYTFGNAVNHIYTTISNIPQSLRSSDPPTSTDIDPTLIKCLSNSARHRDRGHPCRQGLHGPTASVAGESEVLLMVMVADGGSTVF